MKADQTSAKRCQLKPLLSTTGRRPHPRRRPREDGQPGQNAGGEDRNEIPPRAFAMVLVGEEALEMLVDEKEMEEFRIGERHGDEPWRGDQREQQQAAEQMQPPPHRPVAGQQRIDETATRRAGRRRSVPSTGRPAPAPTRRSSIHMRCSRSVAAPRCASSSAPKPTLIHKVSPESSVRMCALSTYHTHPPSAAALYRPRRGTAEAKADVADEQHADESGQRGPQTRCPLMNAERLVRSGGQPVLQCRLLEVLDAVQARRKPVAAGHHFARYFRIAAFVGMDQSAIVEIGEPDQREQRGCSAIDADRESGASRRSNDGVDGGGHRAWPRREAGASAILPCSPRERGTRAFAIAFCLLASACR